ncbi:tetratricopeptide repeat protein [candidate division KSB1 bacterium]|nr:tetratricopeptide repeat protein [candidate division KSB1 bacterium]
MLKPRKKLTKQQLKEDKLVTTTYKVNEFITQHSRLITYGAVAVAAIVLFSVLCVRSGRQASRNAATETTMSKFEFYTGRYEAAIEKFKSILDQYEGTRGAGEAAYYLALSHLALGNREEAEATFKLFLKSYGKDRILVSAAHTGLGTILEDQGQFEKAADQYIAAYKVGKDLFSAPQNLINAGRCFQSAGLAGQAREIYQSVLDHYAYSPLRADAENRLAGL